MTINIRAMSIAAVLTFILITVLTIQTELSGDFKTQLASLTGHHWTSKGVVSLTFFALAALVLGAVIHDEPKGVKTSSLLVALAAVICGAIILLFYVLHFLAE